MGERRGVEMVRLEQPEERYDVEQVLGRDAASVFPSLHKELDPLEQLKAAMGAKRFVTESELEQIKASRGLNVDDGTAAADKPLAEVLAEKKQAKQDAFEDQWKQMKTGKNRPLEPDELEFLDRVAEHEAAREAEVRAQEAEELEAYRLAVAAAAEAKAAEAEARAAAGDAGAGPGPGSGAEAVAAAADRGGSGGARAAARPPAKAPALRPVLKVKPKGAAARAAGGGSSKGSDGGSEAAAAAASAGPGAEPSSKRPRTEQGAAADGQRPLQGQGVTAGGGLGGLLGGYGSGSDSDG